MIWSLISQLKTFKFKLEQKAYNLFDSTWILQRVVNAIFLLWFQFILSVSNLSHDNWQSGIIHRCRLNDGKGFISKSNYLNSQMASLDQEKYTLFRHCVFSLVNDIGRFCVLVKYKCLWENENKHELPWISLQCCNMSLIASQTLTTRLVDQHLVQPDKNKTWRSTLLVLCWPADSLQKGLIMRKAFQGFVTSCGE